MVRIDGARYHFHLTAEEQIILPVYKGSTFRGGFGHAFKRVVCVTKGKECNECLLKERCIYVQIFEPPRKSLKGKNPPSTNAVPYIIEPPPEEKGLYQKGDPISFILTLFGNAVNYLPYFIYAFIELGKENGLGRGIERRRGRFTLNHVNLIPFNGDPSQRIYSSEDETLIQHPIRPIILDTVPDEGIREITINFITPTKFIYKGKVLPEKRLSFEIFMKNLFRRISNLVMFHGGEFLRPDAIKALLRQSEDIKVKENRLVFRPWTRYSNRQDRKIDIHGFTGSISFEGEITLFYPYIHIGQLTHVGKSTTMGMGRYEMLLCKVQGGKV